MKHITKIIFILATVATFSFIIFFSVVIRDLVNSFSGIDIRDIVSEYFKVRYYPRSDYCEIMGTTEKGNEQRFLVIPKYIDGMKVNALGYSIIIGFAAPNIKSDVIEKVYFEDKIKNVTGGSFKNCHNAKKIMYPKSSPRGDKIAGFGVVAYFPRKMYEEEYEVVYDSDQYARANVSYYYNYNGAENNGYYWIDDCDYGGTIEYIPAAPKREGYTFAGWYKEAECLNAWDFDTDTLPEEKTETAEVEQNGETVTVENVVYQETILYAKWSEL